MTPRRTFGLTFVVLAIVAAGCGAVEELDASDLDPGQEGALEGTVVLNSIDPCMFPGEHREVCLVDDAHELRLDVDGVEPEVLYHYGDHRRCDNLDASGDGGRTRVGTRVEVFAVVVGHGDGTRSLDVCPSDDYYIEALD